MCFRGYLRLKKHQNFRLRRYFFSTMSCIKIRVYAETKSRTNRVRSYAEQVFHYRPPYEAYPW